MIYSESSITRSALIKSNLQTSMGDLTLFNSDHRIILSCTKSIRMLFERKKSNRLKRQDVTCNGQVIPSSSSVKFFGITLDRFHFRTVATLARHRLLKLMAPPPLHPFIVWLRCASYFASPDIQLSWERALSIPSFIHNDRKRQHTYLPPIHDRNLYLAKCW